MANNKIRPRGFSNGQTDHQYNSFYKLVSNQRFLAIIGLVLLFVIVLPLAKTYSQRRLVEKEITDVQKEIAQFEKDNQELKEMLNYLKSDQSLEAQARINLNLKKPGETVVVIEKGEDEKKQDELQKEQATKSNLKKWFDYFFSR
ncbi:MAG: septum formation initiator family protein [Patescibacteria group bacterium]|jgi:cell division protein FtsB